MLCYYWEKKIIHIKRYNSIFKFSTLHSFYFKNNPTLDCKNEFYISKIRSYTEKQLYVLNSHMIVLPLHRDWIFSFSFTRWGTSSFTLLGDSDTRSEGEQGRGVIQEIWGVKVSELYPMNHQDIIYYMNKHEMIWAIYTIIIKAHHVREFMY